MKHIDETVERGVVVVVLPLPSELGQMQGQGRVGTKGSEERHAQSWLPALLAQGEGGQRGGGKRKGWVLAQPYRLLVGALAAPDERFVAMEAFQPADSLEEVEPIRFLPQASLEGQPGQIVGLA